MSRTITKAFKPANLPRVPDLDNPVLIEYLKQLSSMLEDNLSPSNYLNDRLYEVDQISGVRDINVDFDKDDLTEDGTWRELDLSSIIGKREVMVRLKVLLQGDAAGKEAAFRINNATNIALRNYTQAADVRIGFNGDVKTDANGIIEYRVAAATWAIVDIAVVSFHPVYLIGD